MSDALNNDNGFKFDFDNLSFSSNGKDFALTIYLFSNAGKNWSGAAF